jgi:hypothetical protein
LDWGTSPLLVASHPFPSTLAPHLLGQLKFEKNCLANGARSHPHGFSLSLRLQSVRRRGPRIVCLVPLYFRAHRCGLVALDISNPGPSSARTGRLCQQTVAQDASTCLSWLARLKLGALYTKPRYSARSERCLEKRCRRRLHKGKCPSPAKFRRQTCHLWHRRNCGRGP